MEAYVVLDWLSIVAGLVIYKWEKGVPRVLLGLRSPDRAAPNQWGLPVGVGVLRRDISSAFVEAMRKDQILFDLADFLKEPMAALQSMPERQGQVISGPAGFALAEAKWYVEIPPNVSVEQLEPLKPISQLTAKGLLVQAYFSLEWQGKPPEPAKTKWPFQQVGFFSQEELKNIPVAFNCDEDLKEIFWPIMK